VFSDELVNDLDIVRYGFSIVIVKFIFSTI